MIYLKQYKVYPIALFDILQNDIRKIKILKGLKTALFFGGFLYIAVFDSANAQIIL